MGIRAAPGSGATSRGIVTRKVIMGRGEERGDRDGARKGGTGWE